MAFWLTITFIVSSIFVLTVGQSIPIEFSENALQSNYYEFIFTGLPFSFLLTLIGTIKKKNSKGKNWTIVSFTVFLSVICFFILVNIMFSVGFGEWTNERTLYRKNDDQNITINQQVFDIGAFGYGRHRIVQLTPFLKYFQIIKPIDTTKINKAKWVYVNEEKDVYFP